MNTLRIRAAFTALAVTLLFAVSSSASTAPAQSGQPSLLPAIPPPASTYFQFCFGDGSSGPCPCGNNSAPSSNEGCANSSGAGAMLSGSGIPSIANDTLLLTGTNLMPPNGAVCIFIQGTATISAVPFGAGLRCFSGGLTRIAVRPVIASTSQCGFPVTATVSSLGGVIGPGFRTYAVYYRDVPWSSCPGISFNVTNGLNVNWGP
jgi:hypothetical protein